MSINFPSSPTPGQLYTYGDNTWEWSGDYWGVYSAQTGYVTSVTSSGSGFPVINSYSNNSLVLKSFSGTNMTITDSGGQLNFYVPLNGGSFTGGTVSGATIFTGGLTADTISATTIK